tara:strand:+ start:865 stop:1359 length:495 start_codon:yes stop_codon:yes gene_type:complete
VQHEPYRPCTQRHAGPEPEPKPEPNPKTLSHPYIRTQFGIRLTIGRVEAFANLTEKCSSNNKVVENRERDSSNTYYALEQRGVTDATGVEGGIVRLGVGAADGVTYCHSYAGLGSACYARRGSAGVSSLALQVTQRKPFDATSGRVNFQAIRVLAHEMGHTFGM